MRLCLQTRWVLLWRTVKCRCRGSSTPSIRMAPTSNNKATEQQWLQQRRCTFQAAARNPIDLRWQMEQRGNSVNVVSGCCSDTYRSLSMACPTATWLSRTHRNELTSDKPSDRPRCHLFGGHRQFHSSSEYAKHCVLLLSESCAGARSKRRLLVAPCCCSPFAHTLSHRAVPTSTPCQLQTITCQKGLLLRCCCCHGASTR